MLKSSSSSFSGSAGGASILMGAVAADDGPAFAAPVE